MENSKLLEHYPAFILGEISYFPKDVSSYDQKLQPNLAINNRVEALDLWLKKNLSKNYTDDQRIIEQLGVLSRLSKQSTEEMEQYMRLERETIFTPTDFMRIDKHTNAEIEKNSLSKMQNRLIASVDILAYLEAKGEVFEQNAEGIYQHNELGNLRYDPVGKVLTFTLNGETEIARSAIEAGELVYGYKEKEVENDIFAFIRKGVIQVGKISNNEHSENQSTYQGVEEAKVIRAIAAYLTKEYQGEVGEEAEAEIEVYLEWMQEEKVAESQKVRLGAEELFIDDKVFWVSPFIDLKTNSIVQVVELEGMDSIVITKYEAETTEELLKTLSKLSLGELIDVNPTEHNKIIEQYNLSQKSETSEKQIQQSFTNNYSLDNLKEEGNKQAKAAYVSYLKGNPFPSVLKTFDQTYGMQEGLLIRMEALDEETIFGTSWEKGNPVIEEKAENLYAVYRKSPEEQSRFIREEYSTLANDLEAHVELEKGCSM
ncbi:hypothetical protein JR549_002882 [Listeria monocytogenes serotype 1/2a]|nr:hypothetical protein [Listeria monocytogenes serotype 1/2a]